MAEDLPANARPFGSTTNPPYNQPPYKHRTSEMAKKFGLNIVMNDKMASIFDAIAEEEGITRAEVVRRAVAYYRILRDQKSHNRKVLLADQDGKNQKELLLI